MGEINKNRKHTESTKRHMSESHKSPRPYMRKPIKCVETGVVYLGLEEASKFTGCSRTSISNALSGKTKTGGGYHWERL